VSSQRARICACVQDVSDGLAGRPTVCGELSALAAEAGLTGVQARLNLNPRSGRLYDLGPLWIMLFDLWFALRRGDPAGLPSSSTDGLARAAPSRPSPASTGAQRDSPPKTANRQRSDHRSSYRRRRQGASHARPRRAGARTGYPRCCVVGSTRRVRRTPPAPVTPASTPSDTAADSVVLTADQQQRLNDLTPGTGARHHEAKMASIDR
jgi:hypothetical protein